MPSAPLVSRHQKGAYVIWVLILIPVLVAGLALIFNAGNALATHERARTAADAAAVAAALAVKRELSNLQSADSNIKAAAWERVRAAAEYAAGQNGFIGFVDDCQKKPATSCIDYPPQDAVFSPYNQSPSNAKYIGVKVIKQPDNLLAVKGIIDLLSPVSAMALASVGKVNTCPGIGIGLYGHVPKVTNLKGGSDFRVRDGGIILYSSSSPTALYGDSGATMTAQWIEITGGSAKATSSVNYCCDKYPSCNLACVEDINPDRLTQQLPNYALSTACTAANSQCAIISNVFKCGCSLDSKGVPYGCTTGQLPLQAGRYCGLRIWNSGTSASPLVLSPSPTTNVWDIRGVTNIGGSSDADTWGGLVIYNSVVKGVKDANHEGIIFFDNLEYMNNKNQLLDIGLRMGAGGDKNSTSSLLGLVRIYFNIIFMWEDSQVDITHFVDAGDTKCGKLPDIRTVTTL